MSSVRDFCRTGSFETVLALTYSFDPRFFERVALRDLEAGGARRVLIVADHHEAREAVRRCARDIGLLGHRYRLATAAPSRTFHPKLIARLSPERGRVWVGSGNLTYTGWGGNRELGAGWDMGPGCADDGGWLHELLQSLPEIVASAPARRDLAAIGSGYGWLRPSARERPQVLFNTHGTLASQLRARWRGRRFEKLQVCTGSSDVDGAFLRWACTTFGVETVDICVTPARASFSIQALKRLPAKVRVFIAEPPRLMHAKFYRFSGKQGAAAIMGSANCSAAAWLAEGPNANLELIAVYDDAPARRFASALEVFDAASFELDDIAFGAPERTDEAIDAGCPFWLASVRLTSPRTIEATIEPPPPESATVDLMAGEVEFPMQLSGASFIGLLSRPHGAEGQTLFAAARITLPGGVQHTTDPLWIDNEPDLDRARQSVVETSYTAMMDPARFGDRRERFLNAIRSISYELRGLGSATTIARSFAAARSGRSGAPPEENARPAAPADPAELIRSLQTCPPADERGTSRRDATYTGALRELYGDPEGDPTQRETERRARRVKRSGQTSTNSDPAVREVLNECLVWLKRPSFAETCTSERLINALAFPLLVCVRGAEEGWLSESELSQRATALVEILLKQGYGAGDERGLLQTVRAHHRQAGSEAAFDAAVGDGALFGLFVAALAGGAADRNADAIARAYALSSLFGCPLLTVAVDPSHMNQLLRRLRIDEAHQLVSVRAPCILSALDRLNEAMSKTSKGKTFDRMRLYPAQTILWSPPASWSITPSSPTQSYRTGCIGLDEAAGRGAEVREALQALVSVMVEASDEHERNGESA